MFPIRKQKYNKKRFPIGIILIIFLLNLYFGEKMNIYAASIPFEGEGIAFDSEGNLWMGTHDKAAVTGIRYTANIFGLEIVKRHSAGRSRDITVRSPETKASG